MTTTSQAAPIAKGSTGPRDFTGFEATHFVAAGIGSAVMFPNEAALARVRRHRGLSGAQPRTGIEELANEVLFAPSSVVGGAS